MEQDTAAQIAELQAQLARVRADAEIERERCERRIRQAETALPEQRDPQTVTQNVAAQQEIDALRGALRERDREVKELTGQVRKLEDRLEDNYRQVDGLRRQIEQREDALIQARKDAEIANRRAATGAARSSAPPPKPARTPPPSPPPPPPGRPRLPSLVLGLVLGLLLAGAAGVGLWWLGTLATLPESPRVASSSADGTPAASAGRMRHDG